MNTMINLILASISSNHCVSFQSMISCFVDSGNVYLHPGMLSAINSTYWRPNFDEVNPKPKTKWKNQLSAFVLPFLKCLKRALCSIVGAILDPEILALWTQTKYPTRPSAKSPGHPLLRQLQLCLDPTQSFGGRCRLCPHRLCLRVQRPQSAGF